MDGVNRLGAVSLGLRDWRFDRHQRPAGADAIRRPFIPFLYTRRVSDHCAFENYVAPRFAVTRRIVGAVGDDVLGGPGGNGSSV